MKIIEKALQYEVRSGTHSIGANVRDSACYVCWAFSRAYTSTIFQNLKIEEQKDGRKGIVMTLIECALFDREINCRRAASGALQEMVGRLQTEIPVQDLNQQELKSTQTLIPHGISLISLVDYFLLANRHYCYTVIAPQLARKISFSFFFSLLLFSLIHLPIFFFFFETN